MYEKLRKIRIPVGLRTIKTAIAVLLSLLIVEQHGASSAKVVFATIGAMSAVGVTFKDSILACLTQICGVVIGAVLGVIMLEVGIPPMAGVTVGIVVIISGYQFFKLKLVPVLPCLILVNVCLNGEVSAIPYSLGRIWDTTIGLGIGMIINTLIFPFDNSRKIRQMMIGLDQDLIVFLEDLFDGDEHLPEVDPLTDKLDALEAQLVLFSNQRLMRRKRQKKELQSLQSGEEIAQDLLVELETVRNMRRIGRLNQENWQALRSLGAKIAPCSIPDSWTTEDTVVNYHVSQILRLRQALKRTLQERKNVHRYNSSR